METEKILKEYGFDNTLILQIQKLINKQKNNNIEKNLQYFENLGYSKETILKMINKYYNIINYDLTFIKDKIKFFQSLNFNNKDINKIITSKPSILSYEISTLKNKVNILNQSFSEEETKQLILKMPSILSFNAETLKKKTEILNNLNIKTIILHNPKLTFIQSETLTLARYKYLKSINFTFTDKNIRYLFSDNKRFQTKFKISTDELLKKYCK